MDEKKHHRKHFHERHHEKSIGENSGYSKNEEELVCNFEICVFCGICGEICKKEAIAVDQINRIWNFNRNLCVKCGHCIRHCKVGALKFES
ncbi:4Fe-4S binding protein [Treponema sp. TIM-1]|uniref:ATP-binding protein n=1 Tax=Treponema sp. TIM-1 TaxID=2898417 RepID=UPI0039807670